MAAAQNPELRQTARHSAIYAVGTVFRRVSGLVMLPIYTRYLTPADYGVVELLTTTINLLGILVGLRMGQALFRYYILEEREEQRHEVASTVLLTVILTSALGTLVLALSSSALCRLIFGSTQYLYEFNLFLVTLATNAISAVGMSYLRARRMPVVYVSVAIAVMLFEIVLNVWFVVMLELHVTGVVYSAVISGAVLATALSLYMLVRSGLHFSRPLAWELIGFVWPLILAGLGASYVAFANRYFLRVFGSLHDVGLFALASRLASVLGMAFEAFNMSWVADRFEIVKKSNARAIYAQFFRFLSAVIILAGAALSLFASDFFRIITVPEFYPAARIVPILIVSVIIRMFGWYCNFGAIYMGQTRVLAEAAWGKAMVSTAAFLLLIPPVGVYGAALGLLIGNLVEFAWLYRRSNALYDMGLEWRPVILMATPATILTLIMLILPAGEVVYFALRLIAFAALAVIIIALPVWRADERAMIRDVLLSFMRPRHARKP